MRSGEAAEGLSTAPSGARLPRSTTIPPCAARGFSEERITSGFQFGAAWQFSQIVFPEGANDRRQPTGIIKIFHQEASGRHQIDECGHFATEMVPVVEREP